MEDNKEIPVQIIWKADDMVNLTLTGLEFDQLQKAINVSKLLIDRTIEDNLNTGVFKRVYKSDLTEDGSLRSDFWATEEVNPNQN